MEPLTEHRPLNGPIVYGYLRLVRVSATRQEALTTSLIEYCRQHELELSGVFTERTATKLAPAFTGLSDVLALPGTYGVVVPTASHLGPKAIAARRRKELTALGTRLLLVRAKDVHKTTQRDVPDLGEDWPQAPGFGTTVGADS